MTVRTAKTIAAGAALLGTLMLQLSVISRVRLPLGSPDALLVVLACVALVEGPLYGMVLGFGAGLAADLLSDHTLGRLALVFCLVGYAVGLLREDAGRSVVVPFLAVGTASAASFLLFLATGALLGDPRVSGVPLAGRTAAVVLYDLVLTPFVFPLVAGLLRRVDRERR